MVAYTRFGIADVGFFWEEHKGARCDSWISVGIIFEWLIAIHVNTIRFQI